MKELLPHRKVWVGAVTNAVCVLALKGFKYYGIEFSADEVVQLLLLINFGVQWLVPPADSDRSSPTQEIQPNA